MLTTDLSQPQERLVWYIRRSQRTEDLQFYALVIEDYIAGKLTVNDLAKAYDCDRTHILWIVSLYFKKPDFTLNLVSKV